MILLNLIYVDVHISGTIISFMQIVVYINLFVHIFSKYLMYCSYKYLMYKFTSLFIYSIVYSSHSNFIYECMFLMYIVH